MGDSFSVRARPCHNDGCAAWVVFVIDATSVERHPGERSRSLCEACGTLNVLAATDTRAVTTAH